MKAERDFWSRRRAAVRAEAEASTQAQPETPVEDTRTDAEILAELDLPDPDMLSLGDDVTAFMARAVPEHLRRRALRRLWRLNPVLANLDGLNDYDGDFTTGSVPTGMLQTSYQVGKGLRAHIDALTARDAARRETETAPQDDLREDDLPEDGLEEEIGPDATLAEVAPAPENAPVPDDSPRPSRMAFTFTPEAQA